jgi:glycosyltransferase involved in cell wall biosynthesis
MMGQELVINGRFVARPWTGVDRVASEMLRAIAARIDRRAAGSFTKLRVVTPPVHTAEFHAPPHVTVDRLPGTASVMWEQLRLPGAVGGSWLYSPCNVGPLIYRNQIVTIHDAHIYLTPQSYSRAFRAWYSALLPRLARRAKVVTTVSAFSKQTLEDRGIIPRGKAVVVPNGGDHVLRTPPDPEILQRLGLEPESYFLMVGGLAAHKNLRTLIEARRLPRRHRLPLIVVGEADPRVFSARDLLEESDVRFIGRIADPELRALLDRATALVFPSLVEGFGLPPLEAMGCGCPVIASAIPPVEEVCGSAAILIDPTSPGAWAEQMERLASDRDARTRLSKAGRERAAMYTWDRAAARLLEAIATVGGPSGATSH